MGQSTPRFHALLAGGGTGGHVFPALAVAHELSRRGWTVGLAGSSRGLEARLAAEHDVPFYALPARPLLGKGRGAQIGALLTLVRSAFSAWQLVRRLGSRVVLGTGGYASAPAVIGGWLARRPVLLLEPNARSGAANRWLSRLAREALVAFPQTSDDFHCPSRMTGVPVRADFFEVRDVLPRRREGGEPLRMLVLGGSQGAQQLNELLPPAVAALVPPEGGLEVVHQCGAANLEATRSAYERVGLLGGGSGAGHLGEATQGPPVRVRITPFIDDMAAAMEQAHLLVSRAGALTVSEIAAAGRAAIFLPLSIAAGHQVDNARALVDGGAALMLEAKDASAESLRGLLSDLLAEPGSLTTMGARARALGRPAAVATIANRLERAAGGGPRDE